jgi:hypothetical protein
MQYVNDDMDELFRKAAKDYPLNTGGADWEKLQKALEEPPAGEGPPAGKRDRRHLLWLLLLLPLPWICTQFTGDSDKGTATVPAVHKEVSTPVDIRPIDKYTPSVKDQGNAITGPVGSSNSAVVSRPTLIGSTPEEQDIVYKAARNDRHVINNDREGVEDTGLPITTKDKEETNMEVVDPALTMEKIVATPDSSGKKQETPVPTEPTDTTAPVQPDQKKEPAPKARRFYAGVIGGADITSIEMQKVRKIGYDLGGVVGYSINDRWSVEAGLLSSEKAYYSSGEHLYKAYTLPGTKLLEAEGDCRMWEVPLVVRYRFNPGKRSGWFASAGSSSYFMKEESYDYTYYYTATGQEVKRSRSYYSDSRHLFAAAQLSGGYSRRLGKAVELRIEPYLKLPLRKVGYYKLPLTSFGVHAGITRKLF